MLDLLSDLLILGSLNVKNRRCAAGGRRIGQVTAQDRVTVVTYYLDVTLVSTNADLMSLTMSNGVYNPAFNPAITYYSAIVTNSSVTITPLGPLKPYLMAIWPVVAA